MFHAIFHARFHFLTAFYLWIALSMDSGTSYPSNWCTTVPLVLYCSNHAASDFPEAGVIEFADVNVSVGQLSDRGSPIGVPESLTVGL